MSTHIETADAAYATKTLEILTPEEYEDFAPSDFDPTTKHAVVVDTGGDAIVIEGTPEELVAFAERLLSLATDAERAAR